VTRYGDRYSRDGRSVWDARPEDLAMGHALYGLGSWRWVGGDGGTASSVCITIYIKVDVE
jgi:hypothetical protein